MGDTVHFNVDKKNPIGIIGGFGIVDSSGRTSVVLRSSPINGVCKIYAQTSDQLLKDSTTVLFSGVKIELTADPIDLKTGEYSTVQALLSDASGLAIEGDQITFMTTNGIFEDG